MISTSRSTFIIMTMSLLAFVWPLKAQPMDPQQQALVLMEAQQEYDEAAEMLRTNPAEAADAFRASAARFQLLVDSGISNGSLYYDLGNAWYQAGDLGHAIANYLRAERLMPDDPRLDANLAYARSQVRPQITDNDHVALLRRLVFWHDSWTLRMRIWGFGIAWVALWLALIIRSIRRYPGWNYIAGCAAAASIMLGVSALWDIGLDSGNTRGVLVGDQVIVRKGNAESFSPQFEEPINRGVEFKVLEERPQWLHIELGNGEKGWIQSSDAEIVQGMPSPAELTATTRRHGSAGPPTGS